jgi:hypothetical protein
MGQEMDQETPEIQDPEKDPETVQWANDVIGLDPESTLMKDRDIIETCNRNEETIETPDYLMTLVMIEIMGLLI